MNLLAKIIVNSNMYNLVDVHSKRNNFCDFEASREIMKKTFQTKSLYGRKYA